MNRIKQLAAAAIIQPMPFRRYLIAMMSVFVVLLCLVNVYCFYVLTNDVELLSARHHMDKIARQLEQATLQAGQSELDIDPNTRAYIGAFNLPPALTAARSLKPGQPREFDVTDRSYQRVYVMKLALPLNGQPVEVFIAHYNESFEAIEDELLDLQQVNMLLSVGILLLSLVVLLKLASRLTSPLSALADELTARQADNLSPLPAVQPQAPSELGQLVDSVNQYQAQIRELLDRERAFNRYASHELRTPMMVIQGAANLLKHSDKPEFVAKQRERILQACHEMNDFVATLLSLTRDEQQENLCQREITAPETEAIVAEHMHLLQGKPVSCHVHTKLLPQVLAPESTIKILLGNLIKNAFAHTEQGEVVVSLHRDAITVADTGCGLENKPAGVQGYGLGLLIANDICRKYGWRLTLRDNPDGGCISCIRFSGDAAQ